MRLQEFRQLTVIRMSRILARILVPGVVLMGNAASVVATPATPSYHEIETAIAAIRSSWANAQGDDLRRAEGWGAFTTAVEQALAAYTSASDAANRDAALARLSSLSQALSVSAWPPGQRLRHAIDHWVHPRMSLVEASRRLEATIRSLPPAASTDLQANRDRWLSLDQRLGAALKAYESAGDPVDRVEALDTLRGELEILRSTGVSQPWAPALALHESLARLFENPNVEALADRPAVSPLLEQQVVFPEVLYRRGQYSYITPGPKTGFGLLPNDQGITFYNSQIAYSVTPVRGFQDQIAADERGRRVAKLYKFDATIYNTSEARVFITVNTNGIDINPQPVNNVDAKINSQKQPGHGPHVTRSVASLIGFNQQRITNEVYKNGIGQIREEAEIGAREEAQEKSARAEAELNAQASRYLVGGNTIAVGDLALQGVRLQSRPEYIFGQGILTFQGVPGQIGADFPQPPEFATPDSGVTIDFHLTSALSNVARGYFQTPRFQKVQNILIEIRPEDAEAGTGRGIATTENVDFPTFLDALKRARETGNPDALALRVHRPAQTPEFTADREGNLVAVLRGLVVEVPAPPAAARGGGIAGPPAQVYRLDMPRASVTLSFEVQTDPASPTPKIVGKVVSFDPGQGAAVYAINDDENAAQRLNAIASTVALGALRSRIANQPIDYAAPPVNLEGFRLRSVSALHPTGWMRANLISTR